MNSDNLIELREELNMTQSQMAKKLGVTRSAYSLWEIGKNTIPLIQLNNIANKFDASLDYLTGLSRKNDTDFKYVELDKVEIGKRLKQVRLDNKMTQEAIADKLNTTHSVISAYENGKVLIPTIFIIEYANITGKSIDYLCCKKD